MAKTGGHGNPNWTRDEVILALDLYLRMKGNVPSSSHQEIVALSELLRRMPYHAEASKRASFRNKDGVAFKLQNIRQVATGKGFGNVSSVDKAVWAEFSNQPELLSRLAAAIRKLVVEPAPLVGWEEEAETFAEGRLLTALHYRRERDPKLRKAILKKRMAAGLKCEGCDSDQKRFPEEIRLALFEVHHLQPLSDTGEKVTKIEDVALLCACCHRAIHKMIALQGKWVSLSDLRAAQSD